MEDMFDLGVRAVQRLWPDLGPVYVCPTCLRVFDSVDLDAGRLSREHVPPEALGGKVLTLTCVECNNTAGRTVDAAWAVREDIHNFAAGTPLSRPWRFTLEIGGSPINVSATHDEDGRLVVQGVPRANNPVNTAAHIEHMDCLVASESGGDGETFTISGWAHNPRLARVAVLRSAYLVVFAKFGYSFALAPGLKKVRAQIQDWNADLGAEALTIFDPASDPGTRSVRVVVAPVEGLLVRMGRAIAFLPHPDGNPDSVIPADSSFKMVRGEIPWPTTMELALDSDRSGPLT